MIVALLLLALNVIFVFVGLVDAYLYIQPTTHSLELPKDWLEREFEQLEATVRNRELLAAAMRPQHYSAYDVQSMLYGGRPIETLYQQQADLQQMAWRQQIDMNNLQFNLANLSNQYTPFKAM